MKPQKNIHCDLVVIGAGLAGMVAAARASDLGLKTVQTGNPSVFFLNSGLFDLLGVYPMDSGQILTHPYSGIQKLASDQKGHPYSKVSQDQITESIHFAGKVLRAEGLYYDLPGPENKKVLTAVGTVKPTYMVPETVSKGCAGQEKSLLIVDFKGLRGFSARQIAAGIKTRENPPLTLTMDLGGHPNGLNPVHLAASFENPDFIQGLSRKLLEFSGTADLVGMPAICGVHNSLDIIKALETQTGMDIFEIPGMPPSIPGLRLKNAFEKSLSDSSVTVLNTAKIVFQGMDHDHFIFQALNDNFKTQIKARGAILASGRFPGGGLFARRNRVVETIFNLPVFQPETREFWHLLNFFDSKGHPINQAGLETDDMFRPLDRTGIPAFENLYAAGAILAHNDWARLKSGAGVSCVSAYTAVNNFHAKNT